MKKTVTMARDQWTTLVCCLLMTTNYRKNEREAWERLATETEPDGTPRFPKAHGNAEFWADMERKIEEIRRIIDDAPLMND